MSSRERESESGSERVKRRFGGWLPLIGGAIVLFVVYQMGHSSGSRSAVESESRANVTHHTPAEPAADPPRPRNVSTNANQRENNAQRVRHQAIPLDSPQGVPANRPVQNRPAVPANRPAQNRPVVQHRVVQVETEQLPTLIETTAPPSSHELRPPPINSVYEQRSQGTPANISEMGLMPLQPLEPATVYPGTTPVTRTTFRQPTSPALAPVLPSARPATPAPAAHVVSPLTLKCNCGTDH